MYRIQYPSFMLGKELGLKFGLDQDFIKDCGAFLFSFVLFKGFSYLGLYFEIPRLFLRVCWKLIGISVFQSSLLVRIKKDGYFREQQDLHRKPSR